MSKYSIKLIVTGLNPNDLVKCGTIANKVRRYTEKYADIHILIVPNSVGFSGIIIENEDIVYCDDEVESIDKLIEGIAKIISRKRFTEPQIAAGNIK